MDGTLVHKPDLNRNRAKAAQRRWLQVRRRLAGLRGIQLGAAGLACGALAAEVFGGGLNPNQLPWIVLAFLPPLVAVVGASRMRPSLAEAARETDRRAELQDRLGTALEFCESAAPLAPLQRRDAERHTQGLDFSTLFPSPSGRPLWLTGALALAALISVGGALSFDWSLAELPQASADDPTDEDDVLATIEGLRTWAVADGDKKKVRLLWDLEQRIRSIRGREDGLRKQVRRPPPPTEPEDAPPPKPDAPPPFKPELDGLITAEDLERLESEALDHLQLTDEQQTELISDLFRETRAARELAHHFDDILEAEHHASLESPTANQFGENSPSDGVTESINNQDLFEESSVGRNAAPIEEPGRDNLSLVKRDLSEQSQAAHDSGHDLQQSFNQFLKDFVKDVRSIIADAAMGKKQGKDGREVATHTETGIEDQGAAMERAGFEEMGETKRSSGADPSALAGASQSGMASAPPDGEALSQAQASKNPGSQAGATAMRAGSAESGTSAGASGAGRGDGSSEGLTALINATATAPERLEAVLGQIAAGRLPTDRREALLDQIAERKVVGGLNRDDDPVVADYHAEAEELLISHRESLSPLFRDFAHSYFETIWSPSEANAESD